MKVKHNTISCIGVISYQNAVYGCLFQFVLKRFSLILIYKYVQLLNANTHSPIFNELVEESEVKLAIVRRFGHQRPCAYVIFLTDDPQALGRVPW